MSLDNVKLSDLFTDYPEDGITIQVTFTEDDLKEILFADWQGGSIFEHIITLIHTKKNSLNNE